MQKNDTQKELEKLGMSEQKEEKDPNYWRSFKELFQDKSLLELKRHEFGEGVTEDFDPSNLKGISRRKFLTLVGASAALAAAGCSEYRNKGDIVPYNKMPEDVVVGNSNYYASTSTACRTGCGVLIKTREGRPIKVDGNPDHPISKGKTCAKCQASILSLYDPERLQEPMKKTQNGSFINTTWKVVDDDIIDLLSKAEGRQIAVITHTINSPTTKKVLDDFAEKYPGVKIYSYELFDEHLRDSAWRKCYGSGSFPILKWNEAKIIVGLEADFLGSEGDKVETARLFSEGREVNNLDKFNRLYVIEGNMTITGMNADYRIRLRPDAQYEFVMSLLNEISKHGVSIPANISLRSFNLESFSAKHNVSIKKLNHLIKDLLENRGKSIVYAGRTLPEKVHIAVNLLNEVLGNTELYRKDVSIHNVISLSSYDDFSNLTQQIKNGEVAVVIHFDSNPVFHLPKELDYENALKKVPCVISLTGNKNESSLNSNFVLPINHDFESWGDFKTRTGFYSMQQPVIDPIFNSRQKEAILLNWINGKPVYYDPMVYHKYLKQNWQQNIYPTTKSKLSFNEFWNAGLHDGVIFIDESVSGSTTFNTDALSVLDQEKSDNSTYVLLLREGYQSGDGRFLNNGWMLELPHPVSKVTWDNYAAISNSTAKALNVKSNDVISINTPGTNLKIPVFIQPGAADNTIAIELGFGRKVVGVVGEGVGFDAIPLMSYSNSHSPWIISASNILKTDENYKLVSTIDHHMMEEVREKKIAEKRKIIQEGTVKEYKRNSKFLSKKNEKNNLSIYNEHDYPGVKWGMVVDLNKCIGCGECVVACVAENNIPVVGKDQVAVSREMQWLRVDRYYSGLIDDPKVSNELMLCQQCDNAPCENVCPVAATTHSPDGLNQMVYNRCVGTRYCSNNCPYKVRRFNFFNYRDHFKNGYQQSNLLSLVYNPEVTVRSRGVMEKCTFCIQRIMEARSEAIKEHRPLKGSDVTTACQDACNTNAIKFGDINDKESEFYKFREHELGYYVLEDLNTKPNVTYIAKLRNTDAEEI
jgi:molybdopterin-containing oxidoreductase family iron-sulfur binding subunit